MFIPVYAKFGYATPIIRVNPFKSKTTVPADPVMRMALWFWRGGEVRLPVRT
jgi:hypothetical protein